MPLSSTESDDKKTSLKYMLGAAALATVGAGTWWLYQPSKKDPRISNGDYIRSAAVLKAADVRLSMKGQPAVDIPAKRAGGSGRVAIPKIALNEREIIANGFVPSKVAVPEKDQESLITYRHPHNNLHIHKHKNYWFVHKDAKTPISMSIVKGDVSPKTIIEGTQHVVTEGIPGMASYIKNWLPWSDSFDDQMKKQEKATNQKMI